MFLVDNKYQKLDWVYPQEDWRYYFEIQKEITNLHEKKIFEEEEEEEEKEGEGEELFPEKNAVLVWFG